VRWVTLKQSSIDADGGEHQSDGGKDAEKEHGEAASGKGSPREAGPLVATAPWEFRIHLLSSLRAAATIGDSLGAQRESTLLNRQAPGTANKR